MTGGTGPVAVVGGASRGLGLLICRELISRGYAVHAGARSGEELEQAQAWMASQGLPDGFTGHECDVRDAESVAGLVERAAGDAEARGSSVEAAIHVAGVIQVGPVESLTLGHFHEAVDTMLWGPIHLALAVLPVMRASGRGRIGIVSSVGGVVSVPRLVPYSVAKFGAVGLAEGLDAELRGSGITVTSVIPGLMRTGGHVAAEFTGDAEVDYPWFATGASMPLLSVSADRAARRIVDGVLKGRTTVELTPLTMVGRRVHGLAPGLTTRAMGLVSDALPKGDPPDRAGATDASVGLRHDAPSEAGRDIRKRLRSNVLEAITAIGTRAGRRNNERL